MGGSLATASAQGKNATEKEEESASYYFILQAVTMTVFGDGTFLPCLHTKLSRGCRDELPLKRDNGNLPKIAAVFNKHGYTMAMG